jgi:hypothetical protein
VLLPLLPMGVSEKCQVVLTLLSHSAYNVRASKEVGPRQEVALGSVDMDMSVPSRWCACVRECGQARPFAMLDTVHQQMCSRVGWTVKCFVVKDAMISKIRMLCGCFHSVIVQVVQVGRWHPLCVLVR